MLSTVTAVTPKAGTSLLASSSCGTSLQRSGRRSEAAVLSAALWIRSIHMYHTVYVHCVRMYHSGSLYKQDQGAMDMQRMGSLRPWS